MCTLTSDWPVKFDYAIQITPFVTDWALLLAKLLRFGSLIESFTDIIILFNKKIHFCVFHCDISMLWVFRLDGFYFNDIVMNNALNGEHLTILSVKTGYRKLSVRHTALLVSRKCSFIHLYIYYHIFWHPSFWHICLHNRKSTVSGILSCVTLLHVCLSIYKQISFLECFPFHRNSKNCDEAIGLAHKMARFALRIPIIWLQVYIMAS